MKYRLTRAERYHKRLLARLPMRPHKVKRGTWREIVRRATKTELIDKQHFSDWFEWRIKPSLD